MTGFDRWKNGEVVGKKEQFLIQIWRNEGIQFLACLFQKGVKRGKFGDLEKGRGVHGIESKMILEFRVKIWVRYESKCCDLLGGTSNGVVEKNQIGVAMGEKNCG